MLLPVGVGHQLASLISSADEPNFNLSHSEYKIIHYAESVRRGEINETASMFHGIRATTTWRTIHGYLPSQIVFNFQPVGVHFSLRARCRSGIASCACWSQRWWALITTVRHHTGLAILTSKLSTNEYGTTTVMQFNAVGHTAVRCCYRLRGKPNLFIIALFGEPA